MSNSEQNNSWADIAAHHKDKGGNKQRATDPSSSAASTTTNPEQRVPSIDDAPGGSSNNFPLPQETVKDKSPSSSGVSDLLNQSGELIDEEEANNTLSPERSYAFVSDFPSPQEAARREKAKSPTPSHTSSSGVGDLLNNNNNNNNNEHKANKEDTTIPPHPARSFANVAGNKDFPNMPAPEENTLSSSTDSLSDLPDVKEMLSSPSVKVPPPPASQSFAKMAAKPAPVEEKPSERLEAIEQQNRQQRQQQKDALPQHTHDDFPTLQQANQMAENNVDHNQPKERAMFTEISKLSEAVDAAAADRPQEEDTATAPNDVKASFASVTGSNLDVAPPSASPQPVPQHPVFDEETVMLENTRREIRRWRQKEPGEEITPEMKPMEEQREERVKEREAETVGPAELEQRVQSFDRSKRGKITIWDTFRALRGLGYSCLTALPATFLLHLRLSPLTSPYRFPFFYRSISDLLTLPIYVNRVPAALTIGSPLLGGQRSHELVRKYGSETTTQGKSMRGLGFWAGMRGIGACENLRWWQFAPRIIHRLQWFMIYTMLQDPQSHLVSEGVLASLPSSSTSSA